MEILMINFSTLSLEEKNLTTLKQMGKYFEDVSKMIGAQGPQFQYGEFEGLPLEVKVYDQGEKLKRTMSIEETLKFSPKKDSFSLPKDYTKRNLPLF
jgi:hypothetical protein